MTTYLLDRNVVSDIRKSLAGHVSVDVGLARSVDIAGNFISPILSIIEGNEQERQTAATMYDSLESETASLRDFYAHARTDAPFLRGHAVEFITAFMAEKREKFARLAPLAKELQQSLGNPVSVTKARPVLELILRSASARGVNPAHPLVVIGIACLYGNDHARQLLKPSGKATAITDSSAHNAVFDVLKLMDISYIKGMMQTAAPGQEIELLTRDKALAALSTSLGLQARSAMQMEGSPVEFVRYDTTIPFSLFTNIVNDPEELEHLMRAVQNASARTFIT